MQRYENLVEFREKSNELYETIKILQIFIDSSYDDITLTIKEKLYEITDMIDDCFNKYHQLNPYILKKNNNLKTSKKIIDFNEIKIKLYEIKICINLLKLVLEYIPNKVSYDEILKLLDIVLNNSENIIYLANRTKLKIYPLESTRKKIIC